MTKKKKILIVLGVIVTLGIVAFIVHRQLSKSSDKYEDIYPWMQGWSNVKKEYFKLYRFRAMTNWYMGDGGNYPREEAEGRAIWHFENGTETTTGEWNELWEAYRQLKKLDENGY